MNGVNGWKKALPVILVLSAALTALLFKLLSLVPLLPPAAAAEALIVDSAFGHMLALTVPIYGCVIAVLIYSIWAFRARSQEEEGKAFRSSRGRLFESVWIAASVVLTFGLAAYGTEEFLELRGDGRADMDVQVRAAQWSWEFFYPDRKAYSPELILPRGKRVRLLITSDDVVHAFWVPEFRLKQDALPGRVVSLIVTPTVSGEYELVCAELCGLDHTLMRSKVRVVEPEEYETKLGQEGW